MALSRTVFRLLGRRNAAILAAVGRRHYSSTDEVKLKQASREGGVSVNRICELGHHLSLSLSLSHTHTHTQTVGFIGLGNMGAPMAQNLLKSGHKLIVYDVTPTSLEKAVSAGAVKADSPAHVAEQSRTIVTMLPAGTHVLECYKGENGILRLVEPVSIPFQTMCVSLAKIFVHTRLLQITFFGVIIAF